MNVMMVEREQFVQGIPGARTNLIAQARSLIDALETPMEHLLTVIWANVRIKPLP